MTQSYKVRRGFGEEEKKNKQTKTNEQTKKDKKKRRTKQTKKEGENRESRNKDKDEIAGSGRSTCERFAVIYMTKIISSVVR